MTLLKPLATVGILLAMMTPVSAQTIHTGNAPTDESYFGSYYGYFDTDAGQSFTALGALTRFTFYMDNTPSYAVFHAYVVGWDAVAGVTTPRLWEGDYRYGADGPFAAVFETGGLALTPGQIYAAFLETNSFSSGNVMYGAEDYAGGSLVTDFNGGGYWASWHTENSGVYDAAFSAEFANSTVTPEPFTMTLMGTGLAGLAAARKRRKGQVTTG